MSAASNGGDDRFEKSMVECEHRREVKNAILGLAGSMTAASDQAEAMTDAELGALLLSGRWTTIEIHEAGRRLSGR